MKPGRINRALWLVLASLGIFLDAHAQRRLRLVEEPRWLRIGISDVSLGAYAEGTFEDVRFQNGSSLTHSRIFVGPSIGVGMGGSVYHPYLFQFQLQSEGAYGWSEETVGGRDAQSRSETLYLGRFAGSANIFGNKPLNGTIFGNYDHSLREYDFFNSVTVDSWRYGGRLNYSKEAFTGTLGYTHRDEESGNPFRVEQIVAVTSTVGGTNLVTLRTNRHALNQVSSSREDVVTLTLAHSRARGDSSLSYSLTEYSRDDFGRSGDGRDHSISIGDGERFGAREQFRLNSNAGYQRRETPDESSDEINANAQFTAEHAHHLDSLYDVSFNRFTTGAFESDNGSARAELHHQLYESLHSSLILQGADYEASDEVSSGYTRRFGGGFSEHYTKRLPLDGRIRVDNTFMVDHVEQKSLSTVKNERHAFSGSVGASTEDSFFLNVPNVNENTIEVTDANDSQPAFIRGVDYDVRLEGSRIILERISGGRIPSGATVLVDYEAQPGNAGEYESITETLQVRMDLWKNFWGIYGRVSLFRNTAEEELHVLDLTSYTLGTDFNWKWARAGAEVEYYTSSESSYQSARLFQSFTFKPDEMSSLGLNLNEAWTRHDEGRRSEQNYRAIARYHRGLTRRLGLDCDAGVSLRRGEGVDQTLAAFRPALRYVIGKTTVQAAYDFEYQLFLDSEERYKHMISIRASRRL